MSTKTTYFDLVKYEGADLFNPLTVENGNADKISEQMHKNLVASAGAATELVSGVAHAITRVNTDVPLFHFTATGNWKAGDTMTVNGANVTVQMANGSALGAGAYVIGAEVFGYLRDTLVTIINVSGASGGDIDATTLGGHDVDYFATSEEVAMLQADKANKSVGVSVQLTVAGWSASGDKYTQTVSVAGMKSDSNIVVAPTPTSRDNYLGAYIQSTAQGANSLTFEAYSLPTAAIYANVIIIG